MPDLCRRVSQIPSLGRMPPARRCRVRFLLQFSCTLVVLASGASLGLSASLNPPSSFLGIDPRDEGYFVADVIACRDGSKSFRRDRLNDVFCDCPDGTDEPGTSACPEGRFYCRNIGDKPVVLFSSRVNDHICDCCDGSDEYDGGISCPNTCSKDPDFSKGSTTYDSEERKLTQIDARENKRRVDLEDLILRLKELRIAVFVELLVAACVISSCLFHRHARSRRRRRWYRN